MPRIVTTAPATRMSNQISLNAIGIVTSSSASNSAQAASPAIITAKVGAIGNPRRFHESTASRPEMAVATPKGIAMGLG